jgi:hypothetical protein
MGFLIAQIPNEAIQASLRLDLLFRLLVVGAGWFIEPFKFGAGIFADHFARGIQDFELGLYAGLRLVLQVVIDHGSCGRILRRAFQGIVFGKLAGLNTVRGCGGVEMNIQLRHVVTELAQGTDVVENPERATVGCDHEIVVFDYEVVHRRSWQIQLEWPPIGTVVEGDVNAVLGCGVEQSALLGIFADGAHEAALGNPIG